MNLDRKIIWIPIWVSLAFIVFNFFFVSVFQGALTETADQMLEDQKKQLIVASSLFIFPNLFLTFLLYTFFKTAAQSNRELYTMCYSGIIGGMLPQVLIYSFFYSSYMEYGGKLPVLFFGFPFTYLVGVMIGWVVGLFIVSVRRK